MGAAACPLLVGKTAVNLKDSYQKYDIFAHSKRHGVTETVVSDVLREQPVECALSPT